MIPIRTGEREVEPVTTRTGGALRGLARPAAVVAAWRIRAVIPCYNRASDLSLLLDDLAGLELGPRGRIALSVLIVDNASEPPLETIVVPASLAVEFVRLEKNCGGSGGFNAGMARVLGRGVAGDASELLWLLDSDVRLDSGALLPLVEALEANPTLGAVGSALVDPESGQVFEAGGRVNRRTGEYEQPWDDGQAAERLVPAEYLAACSLLVRRAAAEQAGPMEDYFVNGDDVEWCLRMARRTGLGLAAVPASRARHPHPDRMRTWGRYYSSRNAQYVLAAAGAGRWARLGRALRDTGRAVAQTLMGRDDLAELHLWGLRDALDGVKGPAPEGRLRFEPWRGISELPGAVRQLLALNPPRGRILLRRRLLADPGPFTRALNAACVEPVILPEPPAPRGLAAAGGVFSAMRRLLAGPPWSIAVVSARGRPADWLAGRVLVTVAPEGFVLRRTSAIERGVRLARVIARGGWRSAALALRRTSGSPRAAERDEPVRARLSLSAVILSYNRAEALERTLRALLSDPAAGGAEVFVADNASTDGTHEVLRRFPAVRVVALTENTGIGAFNRAARLATGEALLILDDDAAPAEGALERALDVLTHRPGLGAVTLHPRHPATGQSEWPFAEGGDPCDDWPLMGCGNLVRRSAWERVGGYCEPYFLYRNDADLAMSLLGAGWGVHFDPSLVVHHDSAAAARKPRRWFWLGTRNWVWMCRRHGRGLSMLGAIGAGVLNAHRLAGRDVMAHLAVWRGVLGGCRRPPPSAGGLRRDGSAVRRLLRVRLGKPTLRKERR